MKVVDQPTTWMMNMMFLIYQKDLRSFSGSSPVKISPTGGFSKRGPSFAQRASWRRPSWRWPTLTGTVPWRLEGTGWIHPQPLECFQCKFMDLCTDEFIFFVGWFSNSTWFVLWCFQHWSLLITKSILFLRLRFFNRSWRWNHPGSPKLNATGFPVTGLVTARHGWAVGEATKAW